jgi:hypothetical protein
LVVKTGAPGAGRRIELKPGVNRLGRSPNNDFLIDDPSVSGTHCQIVVERGTVLVRDLGSTNGTFVDQVSVQEVVLQSGQTLRLGCVEMVLESGGALAESAAVSVGVAPAMESETAALQADATAVAATAGAGTEAGGEPAVCHHHRRALARWVCGSCHKFLCDLCISSRRAGPTEGKVCRGCGGECAPVAVRLVAPERKSFFALLPGTFSYPFKGDGLMLLIAGTVFFAVLDFAAYVAGYAPLLGFVALVIITVFGLGYLFAYAKNIVATSAQGEDRTPGWPDFSEWGSDIIVPFFQLLALLLMSFGPPVALAGWGISEGWLPGWTLGPAFAVGCLVAPMALLGISLYDTIAALNPVLIVVSILKVPVDYLAACVVFGLVVLVQWLGELLLKAVLPVPIVPPLVSTFVGLYFFTVEMRVLGLLYLANKARLGWFGR